MAASTGKRGSDGTARGSPATVTIRNTGRKAVWVRDDKGKFHCVEPGCCKKVPAAHRAPDQRVAKLRALGLVEDDRKGAKPQKPVAARKGGKGSRKKPAAAGAAKKKPARKKAATKSSRKRAKKATASPRAADAASS